MVAGCIDARSGSDGIAVGATTLSVGVVGPPARSDRLGQARVERGRGRQEGQDAHDPAHAPQLRLDRLADRVHLQVGEIGLGDRLALAMGEELGTEARHSAGMLVRA